MWVYGDAYSLQPITSTSTSFKLRYNQQLYVEASGFYCKKSASFNALSTVEIFNNALNGGMANDNKYPVDSSSFEPLSSFTGALYKDKTKGRLLTYYYQYRGWNVP